MESKKLLIDVLAGLISGLLLSAALKYAFDFTWFQGLVLSYMWCFIRDSIQNLKK